MSQQEWPEGTLVERLHYLDDMIFAAVCEGIDASALLSKRDAILWKLENGDHHEG